MKKIIVVVAFLLVITNISYATNEKIKPATYEELVSWYKSLEELYPNYIEVFKANEMFGLGKATGGYDLYYVRITNESNGFLKPEVLFLGGPHGDETVGTIGLYWTAKWLVERAAEGDEWIKWLLDNREIYIEICHNPYGFDNRQRYDANDWDLNREADYDWRGYNSQLWGSVNGKTLYHFINSHAIRTGADFHGGVRMILYPWSSTHANVKAYSPFSGKEYTHAPPDFYFYHTACLRLGEYMGSYGGRLDEDNIGTIPTAIGYTAPGCIAAWAYGANVERCPAEDDFVNDEIFGNYDGCGIFWISPEMSKIKDPPEWQFGDEEQGYIAEVIRFVIHQTDLAQPYIRWVYPSNNSFATGEVTVKWQVYGCLVADETYVAYSFSKNLSDWIEGKRHDDYNGSYTGGTYWDGKVWEEKIPLPENATDVYVVAYAKVDGIYKNVVAPSIYGNNSYLRIIEERTNKSYVEALNTSDGIEVIEGRLWWKSPVLHIKIGGISKPREGYLYLMGKEIMRLPGKTIIIGKMNVEVKGEYDKVEFYLDNELVHVDDSMPYQWQISNAFGKHEIVAKMYVDDVVYEDNLEAIMFVK